MPWKVVKVKGKKGGKGGYKVKNTDTGKTYSKKPMTKTKAQAQKRALYALAKEDVEFKLNDAFGLIIERELTYRARENLPDSAFVYPKERRYPIHDINHARNALARSSGKPEERKVRAAVYKRYPSLRKGKKS